METVLHVFGYVKRQSCHLVNIWHISVVSSFFCLFFLSLPTILFIFAESFHKYKLGMGRREDGSFQNLNEISNEYETLSAI